MKYFFILILTSCLLSCNSVNNDEILISKLPLDNLESQQQIVGQLSGYYPLENGKLLKARWSKKERQVSKTYLKQLIAVLGIKSEEQDYVSPNDNPAIDLLLEPYKGTNVYGILEATAPTNDFIILGAHFDSGWPGAPGAIDNATGVTLIYSVVKSIKELEVRNKNIVVVFFDQEEENNVGSRAFIELIEKNNWNIDSIHCFDMVGWDGDGNWEFETFSTSSELLKIYENVCNARNIPLHKIQLKPDVYGSTDFYEFVKAGYLNAVGAGECVYKGDYSPYKDSYEDTYETVDFEYLWSCTNIVGDVIAQLVSERHED